MELKYFQSSEFDSPDEPGSGSKMDLIFLQRLDLLRGKCNFPFKINSGYRTPKHNKEVGGESDSAHLFGHAVDIQCYGWQAYTIVSLAISLGFTGIGIKQHSGAPLEERFVHLDDFHETPTIWTY